MNKHVNTLLLPLILAPLLTACVGTTGSGLVDFDAYASGPADTSGKPGTTHAYKFLSPYSGYTITLSEAMLQIGAVYLDAAPCNGSSEIPPCVDQEASTVAQVTGVPTTSDFVPTSGLFLDTLSPDPQPFKGGGSGIIQDAESAEVWLMSNPGGEEDAIDDVMIAPTIAEVAGTAEKEGETYKFTATVTIGQNRLITASNPALPGLNPICDERIVRPICLTPPIEPEPGTSLHVQVDPKGWFDNVEFADLGAAGGSYQIPDNNNDVTGHNFFQGLESSSGVYSFTFQTP
jgi:hypothetical protein